MDFGITGVAAITVICYLIGCTVKAFRLANRFIPSIVGIVGGFLGIAAMFVMPDRKSVV